MFSKTSMEYMSDKRKHTFRNLDDRTDEENIEGKIVIVTGSNSGIGKQIALQMAKRGAKIIMANRDMEKSEAAAEEIKKIVKNADLDLMKVDLGEIASVKQFAEDFKRKYPHLNILINNAGIMDDNKVIRKTKDGYELHMGVNHLGPFLLTRLLLPHLKKAATSRIVCVSSTNVAFGHLNFDDLMMEKTPKFGNEGKEPYDNSKLANALCIKELSKRLEGTGITVYNVCPGFVKTNVFRHNESWFKGQLTKMKLGLAGLTPEQGCETAVNCAVSAKLSEETGKFYRFSKHWENGDKVLEEELVKKMWTVTEDLLDLKAMEI